MGIVGWSIGPTIYMYHCPRTACEFKTGVRNRIKEHYRKVHRRELPHSLMMSYAVSERT